MMQDGNGGVFQKSAAAYEPRGRLDPAGFQRHVQFATHAPPSDLAAFIDLPKRLYREQKGYIAPLDLERKER